ncbi:MAG: hypothetical protein ACLPY3_05615 [Solirubrobacteraceae bacterium]
MELSRIRPEGHDVTAGILYLRAQLPVLALSGGGDELDRATAEAERLAQAACAPVLGWIADWAAAARLAASDPQAALTRCRAALAALAEHGESYTAARLELDFLPLVLARARVQIAENLAARFEAMGALASATRARSAATHDLSSSVD